MGCLWSRSHPARGLDLRPRAGPRATPRCLPAQRQVQERRSRVLRGPGSSEEGCLPGDQGTVSACIPVFCGRVSPSPPGQFCEVPRTCKEAGNSRKLSPHARARPMQKAPPTRLGTELRLGSLGNSCHFKSRLCWKGATSAR